MPASDDTPGRLRPGDWGAWIEEGPEEGRSGTPGSGGGRSGRKRPRTSGHPPEGEPASGHSSEPPDDFETGRRARAWDEFASRSGSQGHDAALSQDGAEEGSRQRSRGKRRSGGSHGGGRPRGSTGSGGSAWSGGSDGSGGSTRSGGSRRSGGFYGPVEGSSAAEGPPANPEAVARAVCLRLLTMAPRTRAQLAEALRKRNIPDDAAESVLARFSDVGLIDDEAFAEAWVSSRHAGRGLARRALASELRKRGVDEDTVRDAVDRLDPDQELETARRLVERKLPGTRGLEPAARVRRLAGMLARKGYSGSLAYRVVREALENEGQPTDDIPDGFE
ncbi:recombination regulator RecX [Sphaerisporangium sp. NPDC088356]|uniref:recombination regulator RecX n=1 Tax=Sphaerisporangium sp. NPDC088356 TaxID=3154871 RepID=UPI003424115F